MKNLKLSIFIPAYNCSEYLDVLLSEIDFGVLPQGTEIFVIENSSIDETFQIAKKHIGLKNNISLSVIKHTVNYGLGGSFKTAVKYSIENKSDYFIWFHGDNQACFSDLKKVINNINDFGPDCVFGSRFMKKSILKNYSKPREYANRLLNILFSLCLRKRVYDLGSGLNAYRVDKLPTSINRWPNHIAFDANLIFHFYNKNIMWMPILWREQGQVTNARNLNVTMSLLKMLFLFLLKKELIFDTEITEIKNTIYK